MKQIAKKILKAHYDKNEGSPLFSHKEIMADMLSGSLAVFQSERVASAGGRKGGWGEFRPPYKFWAKSVRIFSKAHRQLGNVFVGSPSARSRQPILSANWNFLSLPRRDWPKAGFPNFHF